MRESERLSIVIEEVSKDYGSKKGIHDISTTFTSGQLNVIIGENGSGKSTLFKCIMGLINYSGRIKRRRVRIGYAPEEYILPLNMTVVDFLWSIGRIKGTMRDDLDQNMRYYLDFFGLKGYENHLIGKLSHGMRQKVNLIQAFVHDPRILILDEPTTALDKEMTSKIIKLIKERSRENLVIISTHHPQSFTTRNRRVLCIKEGRLI